MARVCPVDEVERSVVKEAKAAFRAAKERNREREWKKQRERVKLVLSGAGRLWDEVLSSAEASDVAEQNSRTRTRQHLAARLAFASAAPAKRKAGVEEAEAGQPRAGVAPAPAAAAQREGQEPVQKRRKTSKFRGVSWCKHTSKWIVQCSWKGAKKIWRVFYNGAGRRTTVGHGCRAAWAHGF
mmetsp:Transcript_390/g.1263  ORF Transcript_390/g.1263 Transcript_390/m.1263 type:complete len:183 (-) Transcript_390:1615-2163(-)